MSDLDDIFTPTSNWLKNKEKVALATVISTWGSAPRKVGGQMAINNFGEIIGSVSGGCVESSVITEAKTAIKDRKIKIKDYGISDEMAWEVGLACGGELKVLIQPLEYKDEIILKIAKKISSREPITLIINCKSGDRKIVESDSLNFKKFSFLDKENEIFYQVVNPKPRLFVIGAGHISQSLVGMANITGYEVILIDPREHFANKKRFPECKIINEWPDNALENFNLNETSHIVTLTHDPKIDDPALVKVLNSKIGYVGSLGSKRTHEKRINRLNSYGIDDEKLSKIHSPIGLDISSKTPEEISISILAELTQFRRKINEKS